MRLVGQLSNPSALLEAVLGWAPDAADRRRRAPVAALPTARRLGDGVVLRALIKALAVAGRPIGVCEAQTAVEALLGHSGSRESVNGSSPPAPVACGHASSV